MISFIKNSFVYLGRYPYRSRRGNFLFFQYLVLRFLPVSLSFSKINIIPFCLKYFDLSSEAEFFPRYHLARVNFKKIWNARKRETPEEIEQFYREHDGDILRQAYLSKYDYAYKKKILSLFHIVSVSAALKDNILDYGCGAGVLAHYLSAKGYRSVDVADIKSRTLDFVTKSFSGCLQNIIAINQIDELNLGTDRYKVILIIDVLEHTVEPLKIIKKLWTALEIGGILVINFPKETDFSLSHIPQAQAERPAVFEFLQTAGETVISGSIFKKLK